MDAGVEFLDTSLLLCIRNVISTTQFTELACIPGRSFSSSGPFGSDVVMLKIWRHCQTKNELQLGHQRRSAWMDQAKLSAQGIQASTCGHATSEMRLWSLDAQTGEEGTQ